MSPPTHVIRRALAVYGFSRKVGRRKGPAVITKEADMGGGFGNRNWQDENIVERGFTLVELLIVIVILGILAGIVVFAVGNLTSNAKTNACGTEKSPLVTALESYKAQNGAYPATMAL